MGKILIPVVIALCAFVWKMYDDLDMGKTIHNHRPGVCRLVHGPVRGSEDIELVRSEGIALVSSGVVDIPHHNEGKIFIYDFNQKMGADQLIAKEIVIKGAPFGQDDFHPHGLSHWIVNGVLRLYVINHDRDGNHSVEFFDYDPTGPTLIHKKTVKDASMISPNDLVAVGPDQFMFTNDGAAKTATTKMLEFLTGYRGGSVYFWDGKESLALLPALAGPNGITYDIRNNKLIVSELYYSRLHVHDLSKDKKTAAPLSTIDLDTWCDNLFLDHDGSVYCGCHPVAFKIAQSMGDCYGGDTTSPSQILRVKFDKDYKSASVSEMLIGSVCKGLLHCEIADPSVL